MQKCIDRKSLKMHFSSILIQKHQCNTASDSLIKTVEISFSEQMSLTITTIISERAKNNVEHVHSEGQFRAVNLCEMLWVHASCARSGLHIRDGSAVGVTKSSVVHQLATGFAVLTLAVLLYAGLLSLRLMLSQRSTRPVVVSECSRSGGAFCEVECDHPTTTLVVDTNSYKFLQIEHSRH